MAAIDYPISRLMGAVDAGATLTITRSTTRDHLHGVLTSKSGHSAIADEPDLARLAHTLVMRWWTRAMAEPNTTPPEPEPRPHQRVALAELGKAHGMLIGRYPERNVTSYRTDGCECDYCLAFDDAVNRCFEAREQLMQHARAELEQDEPAIVGSDLTGIRLG